MACMNYRGSYGIQFLCKRKHGVWGQELERPGTGNVLENGKVTRERKHRHALALLYHGFRSFGYMVTLIFIISYEYIYKSEMIYDFIHEIFDSIHLVL